MKVKGTQILDLGIGWRRMFGFYLQPIYILYPLYRVTEEER
jgi:hypothetical protein